MFPGSTTKLSEETLATAAIISPKADMVHLTGAVAIETIRPNFGAGFSGVLFVVPASAVATVTTGNIATVVSMPANKVTVLVYSKAKNKWFAGAVS